MYHTTTKSAPKTCHNEPTAITKENIDRIAVEVVKLCEQESNSDKYKRLQKLLRVNEKAAENLLKALDSGQIVHIICQ